MAGALSLSPGTIFAGDFRVVRLLSQGGMGTVYVVEQLSTGKQRALKLMLMNLMADPALRKRFETEARVGALIDSEHVVDVVAAGVDEGTPWLAMELLNGQTLERVVEERGAMPPAEIFAVFEQLCHALAAAHEAGIVHRDLKPENVFLARSRRAGVSFTVKVLDFGIAKIVAESKTTRTESIGSPMWMAPEQADRARITPAADVWALGLLGFFMLTGRSFWRGADDNATVAQLLREILFDPIPTASERAAEFGLRAPPKTFDKWLGRCLSREVGERYPDAQAALDGLRPVLSRDLTPGVTKPAPDDMPNTNDAPMRRGPGRAIVVLLTVLFLAGSVALVLIARRKAWSVTVSAGPSQPVPLPSVLVDAKEGGLTAFGAEGQSEAGGARDRRGSAVAPQLKVGVTKQGHKPAQDQSPPKEQTPPEATPPPDKPSASSDTTGACTPLSARQVQRVVDPQSVMIRRMCWERQRHSDGKDTANVSVSLTIAEDGSTRDVTATGDDAAIAKCIETLAGRWQFPAPGCEQSVNIPFHFATQ
jgi:serine/threonine protein kinase